MITKKRLVRNTARLNLGAPNSKLFFCGRGACRPNLPKGQIAYVTVSS